MSERQRKLLLVIAAREAEGKVPWIQDIARMAEMNDVSAGDELREMKGMGLVAMQLTQRGNSTVMEVRLTSKAKRLLPDVKRVQGLA